MSDKYDSEDLLDTLLGIMVDDDALNTKITDIESEKLSKGKHLTPTIALIDSDSYFPQTWNDKILNRTPAIFYGIEDVQSNDGGGALAKTYKCFIEVLVLDNGQTNDVWKRIARYSRALEELFLSNFKPAVAQGTVKVETVRPIAFKTDLDSSEEIKVGGVSLSITIV